MRNRDRDPRWRGKLAAMKYLAVKLPDVFCLNYTNNFNNFYWELNYVDWYDRRAYASLTLNKDPVCPTCEREL